MITKALIVAKREFWVTVRKKSYIILTIGMPFFMVIYMALVSIPSVMMEKKENARKVIGIVDDAGIINLQTFEIDDITEGSGVSLENAFTSKGSAMYKALVKGVEPILFRNIDDASAALNDKKIFMFYVIPENYVEKGNVRSYTIGGSLFSSKGKSWFMRKLLVSSMLFGAVDDVIQNRIENPLNVTEFVMEEGRFVKKNMVKEIGSVAVPLVFGILLLMSVMMSSGFLLQGIAEEKENRVIEVILSSVDPDELLFGKLLGLGTAGLIQMFVWVTIAWSATAYISAFVFSELSALDLKISTLAVSFVFFILGFLLFGSLMAGTGSLGNNQKESQQLSMLWSLSAVVPMFFIILIIDEPNSLIARVLSYIPFTAPVTMITRVATGKVPWWEIPLAMTVLVIAIYLSIKFFSKVFRVGLLMYGKRPTFRAILKSIKQA